jgi:hypothetical protein
VLVVMCLAYFLQGFKVFLFLSVKDLFKQYLKLEPNESQFYSSLISLPWSFKILYGLLSDNLPLCGGSRRRAYVMLNGSLQSICLLSMAAMGTRMSALVVTSTLFITQINQAFLDVVVDAMMVS